MNHDLQWTPGQFGKGYVEPADGSVVTWGIGNDPYGGPHHAEMATGMIDDTAIVHRDYGAFNINPDGEVSVSIIGQLNPRIFEADPRLHPDSEVSRADNDWHFGRVSSTPPDLEAMRKRWLEAFDLGNDKKELSRQGIENVPVEELKKYREYNRDIGLNQYTQDLYDHIAEHGINEPVYLDYNQDSGVMHLSEGNHRLEIADRLGITHLPTAVYRSGRTPQGRPGAPAPQMIEPDQYGYVPGTLKPSEVGLLTDNSSERLRETISRHEIDFAGSNPQKRTIDANKWRPYCAKIAQGEHQPTSITLPLDIDLHDYKHSNEESAYGAELKQWLEEIDNRLQPETGPTPHHDNEHQMQPGVLGRLKEKLLPKKRFRRKDDTDHEEESDEYEAQKEDWYEEVHNQVGSPVRIPHQEEPWRTHY